jgi:hypothetical protein
VNKRQAWLQRYLRPSVLIKRSIAAGAELIMARAKNLSSPIGIALHCQSKQSK